MAYDYKPEVADAFKDFRRSMTEIAERGASTEAVLARKGITDEQRAIDTLEYELGYELECWDEACKLIEERKAKLGTMLDGQRKKRDAEFGD